MCLAVPGQILDATERDHVRYGRVNFGGVVREVCLDFVPEALVGDYVVVHVGFAISRVDAAEASRTYELLKEMGLLEGEFASEPSESEASPLETEAGRSENEGDEIPRRISR
ncbi:MAG TPA: HypC/HybG/HupF family hydrogenase formation chaperone [Candidatus Cybelea sp.]|nr:HypC/HybG/HupF family hydrogenase formation chaperone [Candidatus Cybelea sp.]